MAAMHQMLSLSTALQAGPDTPIRFTSARCMRRKPTMKSMPSNLLPTLAIGISMHAEAAETSDGEVRKVDKAQAKITIEQGQPCSSPGLASDDDRSSRSGTTRSTRSSLVTKSNSLQSRTAAPMPPARSRSCRRPPVCWAQIWHRVDVPQVSARRRTADTNSALANAIQRARRQTGVNDECTQAMDRVGRKPADGRDCAGTTLWGRARHDGWLRRRLRHGSRQPRRASLSSRCKRRRRRCSNCSSTRRRRSMSC